MLSRIPLELLSINTSPFFCHILHWLRRVTSSVIISDCLHHDTTVDYWFFNFFLKNNPFFWLCWISILESKKLSKLVLPQRQFWHFGWMAFFSNFTCDGLGGTVKRLVAWANLQRPYIRAPRQLVNWAFINVPAVHFGYYGIEHYEREQQSRATLSPVTYKSRYKKLHSFVLISSNKVRVCVYSASGTSKEEGVTL